jgi:hypothetical protein
MTTGPYLYDEGPEPLHTGTPRNRNRLLLAVFGGTVLLGVLLVLLTPVIKGTPEEQSREVAGVFLEALSRATPRPPTCCSARRSATGCSPARWPAST